MKVNKKALDSLNKLGVISYYAGMVSYKELRTINRGKINETYYEFKIRLWHPLCLFMVLCSIVMTLAKAFWGEAKEIISFKKEYLRINDSYYSGNED